MAVHKISADDVVRKGTKNLFKVRMYRANSLFALEQNFGS